MYALVQYIRDYIRSHPEEYQKWLKTKEGKGNGRDAHD